MAFRGQSRFRQPDLPLLSAYAVLGEQPVHTSGRGLRGPGSGLAGTGVGVGRRSDAELPDGILLLPSLDLARSGVCGGASLHDRALPSRRRSAPARRLSGALGVCLDAACPWRADWPGEAPAPGMGDHRVRSGSAVYDAFADDVDIHAVRGSFRPEPGDARLRRGVLRHRGGLRGGGGVPRADAHNGMGGQTAAPSVPLQADVLLSEFEHPGAALLDGLLQRAPPMDLPASGGNVAALPCHGPGPEADLENGSRPGGLARAGLCGAGDDAAHQQFRLQGDPGFPMDPVFPAISRPGDAGLLARHRLGGWRTPRR